MTLSRRLLIQAAGLAAGALTLPQLATGHAKAAAMAPALKQTLDACKPPGNPLQSLLERNQRFSKVWESLGDGTHRSACRSRSPCLRSDARLIAWHLPRVSGLGPP